VQIPYGPPLNKNVRRDMKGLFTEIVGGDSEERTITVTWTDNKFPVTIGKKVILSMGDPVEVMKKENDELRAALKKLYHHWPDLSLEAMKEIETKYGLSER
jgi:hypothetical protein